MEKSLQELQDELVGIVKSRDRQVADMQSKVDAIGLVVDEISARQTSPNFGDVGLLNNQLSAGAQIAQLSEQFEHVKKTQGKQAFAVGSFFPQPTKGLTTVTSDTLGTATPGVLGTDRVAVVTAARRRLTLRDILPSGPVSTNRCEWLKVAAVTPGASPQYAEGSPKGEQVLGITVEYDDCETYASWLPASRQVLDDLPELQRLINSEMMFDLKKVEEYEILRGSGTGTHLNGLITQATAFETGRIDTSDNKLDYLSHALSQAEESDEYPDFIVLNPADYWAIARLKDQNGGTNLGQYIAVDPMSNEILGTPVIWGRRCVVTTAMAEGTFLVGNSEACKIFDRMQAVVELSTEHSDYWTRNLVAIRCEERIGFGVYRTGAFITGDLSTASPL